MPSTGDDQTVQAAAALERKGHSRAPRGDRRWLGAGLSLLLAGFVLLYVAWLSFTEALPLNGLVGIRTADTVASEEEWRRSQRAAAPLTLLQGIVLFAGAAWLLLRRPPRRRAQVVTGVAVALFVALILVAVQVAEA